MIWRIPLRDLLSKILSYISSVVRSHHVRLLASICIVYGFVHILAAWQQRPKIAFMPLLPEAQLNRPIMYAYVPGTDRHLVLEQEGVIKWFQTDSKTTNGVFLDLSDKVKSLSSEDGLMSIVFDTDFKANRFFYICYTPHGENHPVTVARFMVDENNLAVKSSEHQVLRWERVAGMHVGSSMAFGSDGYLYVSIGDGGYRNARDRGVYEDFLQSKDSILGSIVRLDVKDSTPEQPYKIPQDNPFRNEPDARAEIFAHGFRNPWRMSFDRENRLLVADVGSSRRAYEEVNLVMAGGNYGWPTMEGTECHHSTDHGRCKRDDKIMPLGSFAHQSIMNCITGVVFYRGSIPELNNKIIASSYISGIVMMDWPSKTVHRPEILFPKTGAFLQGMGHFKPMIVSMDINPEGEPVLVEFTGKLFTFKRIDIQDEWQGFIDQLFVDFKF